MQDVIEYYKSGFRKMLTNRVRLLEGIEKIAILWRVNKICRVFKGFG